MQRRSWQKSVRDVDSGSTASLASPRRLSGRLSDASPAGAASPSVAASKSMPPTETGPQLRLRSRRCPPGIPVRGLPTLRPGAGTEVPSKSFQRPRVAVDTKARHFLSKLKVRSKGAQRHYKLSVSSFLKWCSKEGYENVSACDPFSQYVDEALEKFMEFLYKSDRSVTAAR